MLRPILLSVLLVQVHTLWILESNQFSVIPRLTANVTLHCFHEDHNDSNIIELIRIRIMKNTRGLNWIEFAGIEIFNRTIVRTAQPDDNNIVVDGYLSETKDSYLRITWLFAGDSTRGKYNCEVDGIDSKTRYYSHSQSNFIRITSTNPTINDLLSFILTLTNRSMENEKKIATLLVKERKKYNYVMDNVFKVHYWPFGRYVLLSPATGCPSTESSTLANGYARIIYNDPKDDPSFHMFPSHFHKDIFSREGFRNELHFRFCRYPYDAEQMGQWPKGNYCIHAYYSYSTACPKGFRSGMFMVQLTSNSTLQHYKMNISSAVTFNRYMIGFNFCCREDGDAETPALLPNKKPFYLYRMGKKCQPVYDMDVTEEKFMLHRDPSEEDKTVPPYPARIPKNGHTLFVFLCYYTPKKRV